MNKTKPKEILELKIKAEAPIIQFVTYEWRRLYGLLVSILDSHEDYSLHWWSISSGLKKYNREEKTLDPEDNDLVSPISILDWYKKQDSLILVLEDFHHFLSENYPNRPQVLSHLREIAKTNSKKTLFLLQPIQLVPIELAKDIFVYELPLPDLNLLKSVLEDAIESVKLPDEKVDDNSLRDIAEAALGLTIEEAKITFREIIIAYNKISRGQITDVISRKEQIIKKSGVLEYFHQTEAFSDVGGMENLKRWLKNRKNGFSREAQEKGLTAPKGVLLLGIPGGGKSLIAKAIASAWNLPLLKFDLGKVFAGVVGASEANIRKAINISNAISPSILWIDEIEKGLSGVSSSDATDGGTTARVFGTLLTWMQEKTEPVFVVATANDISKLPPELLRKGRFDEIFFVDLPGNKTREEIWKIHLRKRLKANFSENDFDFKKLVEESEGFTGAEIEEAVNEGLYRSFANEEKLETKHLLDSIKETYPLSKVMAEDLVKLRKWAKFRARLASNDTVENEKLTKKRDPDDTPPKIRGEKIVIFEE